MNDRSKEGRRVAVIGPQAKNTERTAIKHMTTHGLFCYVAMLNFELFPKETHGEQTMRVRVCRKSLPLVIRLCCSPSIGHCVSTPSGTRSDVIGPVLTIKIRLHSVVEVVMKVLCSRAYDFFFQLFDCLSPVLCPAMDTWLLQNAQPFAVAYQVVLHLSWSRTGF